MAKLAGGTRIYGNTTIDTTLTMGGNIVFSSASTGGGLANVGQIFEYANVTSTAAGANATVNFDVLTQSVLVYNTPATANWILNVRGNDSTTLNVAMANNQSVSFVFVANNSATAYIPSNFAIDGTNVTVKWQNGTSPTTGTSNAFDAYAYTVIKTGNSTYIALGSVNKFQ